MFQLIYNYYINSIICTLYLYIAICRILCTVLFGQYKQICLTGFFKTPLNRFLFSSKNKLPHAGSNVNDARKMQFCRLKDWAKIISNLSSF